MLSIVVPVYKEEQNIDRLCQRLEGVMASAGEVEPAQAREHDYEIVFVLDPSPDRTEEKVLENRKRNPHIKLVVTSRRFGQPAATLAGLKAASGHWVVAIDADLQDPPELILKMLELAKQGNEVVYARRRSRKGETIPKRIISYFGYWLIHKVTDVRIPPNTGDFRLMSRRVVNEVLKLREMHGFLRGLVAFVGFKQAELLYDRDERADGVSKYNRFSGSLRIGLNGIFCYSNKPLAALWIAGFILLPLALLLCISQAICGCSDKLFYTGIATFFGAVQLFGLGLLGEYLSRVYDQTKGRPMYIVDRSFGVEMAKFGE